MNPPISLTRIDAIRASSRKIVRALGFMHDNLAGTTLSPSAVHAIVELGSGSVANASDLAKLLNLEKSSISRLLKKLATDGLISIDESSSDRRFRHLRLTTQGSALLREIEDFAREQLLSSLTRLPRPELRTVEAGLSSFANALSGFDEPSIHVKSETEIREGYQPRLIAGVVDLHISYYAKNYGFGSVFERKVATEISEFMGRIDHPANATFSSYRAGELLGSISIDGEDLGENTAHLRWFIVSQDAQGLGIGRQLIEKAIEFSDKNGFEKTRLWTFRGLNAARRLYEEAGFQLAKETPGSQWGTSVIEQEFVRLKN